MAYDIKVSHIQQYENVLQDQRYPIKSQWLPFVTEKLRTLL